MAHHPLRSRSARMTLHITYAMNWRAMSPARSQSSFLNPSTSASTTRDLPTPRAPEVLPRGLFPGVFSSLSLSMA